MMKASNRIFGTIRALGRMGGLGALVACASSQLPQNSGPPPQSVASRSSVELKYDGQGSVLHGTRVENSYRWLEDPSSAKTQAWVSEQSQLARSTLDGIVNKPALSQRFEQLLDRNAVSTPRAAGARLFFERHAKGTEKAVLVVREGHGAERVLLDPNTMSDNGSVSLGGWVPSPNGKRLVYSQHVNNADEATLYVLDVDTGKALAADVIEGAKYAYPSWTPNSLGFYYEWLPTDPSISTADRPGYTELRYHVLEQPSSADTRVFPASHDPKTFLYGEVSRDGRWLMMMAQTGWSKTDVYVRKIDVRKVSLLDAGKRVEAVNKQREEIEKQFATGPQRVAAYAKRLGFVPLAQDLDATFEVTWWDGYFYIYTNYQAPNYQVFRASPEQLDPKSWQSVIPETAATLDGMKIVGGKLVLSYLENAASRLAVRGLDGSVDKALALPGLGSARGIAGQPDSDELYYSYSSFTVPREVHQASVATGKSSLWFRPKVALDSSKTAVSQVWYPSADGTKISMFLVHKRGLALDGSHPTLLYGYGGFNISLTPVFSSLAAVWVEQGGVYAVPNLRGGGEYGEAWHRAGMGANKQNVFDDYIAAAEFLIDRGYTSAQHLAIYGRSNGGLLVGAAMTQRPDLYRAVVCGVPLLDMVRYHLFGSGKTWIPEYGSADDADQFKTLHAYSPYHHVQAGTAYPDLLMLAADSDDRVDPMHARKFVAAVQGASGLEGSAASLHALFRLEKNAGHGGGDMVSKRVASYSDMTAFLLERLVSGSE